MFIAKFLAAMGTKFTPYALGSCNRFEELNK